MAKILGDFLLTEYPPFPLSFFGQNDFLLRGWGGGILSTEKNPLGSILWAYDNYNDAWLEIVQLTRVEDYKTQGTSSFILSVSPTALDHPSCLSILTHMANVERASPTL